MNVIKDRDEGNKEEIDDGKDGKWKMIDLIRIWFDWIGFIL